MFWTSLSWKGI